MATPDMLFFPMRDGKLTHSVLCHFRNDQVHIIIPHSRASSGASAVAMAYPYYFAAYYVFDFHLYPCLAFNIFCSQTQLAAFVLLRLLLWYVFD